MRISDWSSDRVLFRSDRLIEIGDSRNNLKALVLGLQFKGMSLFCRGQLTSARLYLERALSYRGKAGEIGSDFPSMALIYLSWTVQLLGDQEAALKLLREAEDRKSTRLNSSL